MQGLTRRGLLLGSGAALGALGTRYLYDSGAPERPAFPGNGSPPGNGGTLLNDASELSPTRVAKHLTLTEDPRESFIALLRQELQAARASGRPVAVSAARHSLGGQSLAANGLAVTLDQSLIETDTAAGIYRVAAGVRWHRVIERLDSLGFSPAVMQSNNDFGVASTFCVNAHGWPVPYGPFGGTVRALKLMLSDGQLVTCSRRENAGLFALAMGGYGLTGIVTELDIQMVPNARLEPKYERLPAKGYGSRFAEAVTRDPAVQLAYGRMNVTVERFLEEAVMVTYRPALDQTQLPRASRSGLMGFASRQVLRGQLGSDRMKELRWTLETGVAPLLTGGAMTRNSLLDEPVATLAEDDPTRSDILHEYFVAPERFDDFIAACQAIIPSSYQELLNVTLRYVAGDGESVLAYATAPRIAAVMLFSQEKTRRGEADMARITGALIESVLALGGSYYLPYRLHATARQIVRAYPRLPEFAARKRVLDPGLLFRNSLWDRYMATL